MIEPKKEKKIPVLTLEGTEQLEILNDLLQEIPIRYEPQVRRIWSYLEQHTKSISVPKPATNESEQ